MFMVQHTINERKLGTRLASHRS